MQLEDAVQRAVKSVKRKGITNPNNGGGPPNRITRLRNRHHTIARLVAADVPRERICREMGLTWNVLEMLIEQTPAFQELIVKYRGMPPCPELTDYMSVLERCMLAAELEIADRVLEEPEKLSISELHKVSRDAADRLGYSKHSVNLNVNITLAERLEGLRRRAKAPAGAGDRGGVLSADSAPRSAPPLLELKAGPGDPQARPVLESHATPLAQPPSEGAMSLEEVLALHGTNSPEAVAATKRALTNRRNTMRAEPPPITEPINRRL